MKTTDNLQRSHDSIYHMVLKNDAFAHNVLGF